jgi:hypothetical protein
MFKTLRAKILAWLLSLIGLAAVGAGTGVLPYQQFMPGIGGVGGPLSGLGGSGGGGAGGGGGGGVGVATIQFLGCTASTTASDVITFSSVSTGTAGTNRDTIVVAMADDGATTFGVSGMTIGGDAATEIIDEDGTGLADSALYIFSNDAGTSEDIIVTWSEAIIRSAICVWAAYDLSSTTAVASAASDNSTGANLVLSHNFTGEGVAVGGCTKLGVGEDAVWAGLVEQFELQGESADYSGAHYSSLSSSSPLVIGCDWTGAFYTSGVAASFR